MRLVCKCGKTLKVSDELAGKKIRCPGCREVLLAQEESVVEEKEAALPTASRKPLLREPDEEPERDEGRTRQAPPRLKKKTGKNQASFLSQYGPALGLGAFVVVVAGVLLIVWLMRGGSEDKQGKDNPQQAKTDEGKFPGRDRFADRPGPGDAPGRDGGGKERLEDEAAGEAIRAMNGTITVDSKQPGMPVVEVSFNPTNTLTDAECRHFARLKHLEKLSLSFTKVGDAGLRHLAGLTELQELELWEVSDAGMKQLAGLKRLQKLSIFNDHLTGAGLKELSGLTEMRELKLSGSGKVGDEGMKYVAGLKKLQILGISNTGLSDAGFQELAGLAELRELDLGFTYLTKKSIPVLVGFKKMRKLRLNAFTLIDADWKALAGLAELRELKIEGNGVPDATIKELQKALPACKIEH